jgi:hypothetical protein
MSGKNVAIMQPYVFPYIGYYCLIQASDTFVFYDDVNYIKQGWINRNRLLINKVPYTFTIPLRKRSSFQLIKNINVVDIKKFRSKFIKQLEQSYSKACNYQVGMSYVDRVLDTDIDSISQLAMKSVIEFFEMLNIEKNFLVSSESFGESKGIDKADRLIAIVKSLDSENYMNPIGGMTLYDKQYFSDKGVNLSFVKAKLEKYKQLGGGGFVGGLSIIDVIMNNTIDEMKSHLVNYELV